MDYPLLPSHDTNGLCTTATTNKKSLIYFLFPPPTNLVQKSTDHDLGTPKNVNFKMF